MYKAAQKKVFCHKTLVAFGFLASATLVMASSDVRAEPVDPDPSPTFFTLGDDTPSNPGVGSGISRTFSFSSFSTEGEEEQFETIPLQTGEQGEGESRGSGSQQALAADVPEPGTLALLGAGLVAAGMVRRRLR